jgi:hypothetical protein
MAAVKDDLAIFGAPQGLDMSKPRFHLLIAALLVGLQVGCGANSQPRVDLSDSSGDGPRPRCDTSVRYIDMGTRIRNLSGASIEFHLVGRSGPRYDPWWLGYRVYSGDLGEYMPLVHNASRGSEWDGSVTVAPGDSVEFNTPLFGLRPSDYYRWFRIEMRDSKGRSYWTPPFDLCSVSRPTCGCPRTAAVAVAVGPPASSQACPVGPAPAHCE